MTGITLTGADGTRVFARTMEWGPFDLRPEFLLVPRGYEFRAMQEMPDGAEGLSWTSTYGVAGVNALGRLSFGDVMNEVGLVVGTFYLPGFAEYQA